MTKKEIATDFSIGDFEKIYDHIAEKAVWTIVEADNFIGREAIIANCKQVSLYFKTVNTKFKIINVISENQMVVVNGTAEFLKADKQVSFISACDLYEFNGENLIQNIISYCIEKRKG